MTQADNSVGLAPPSLYLSTCHPEDTGSFFTDISHVGIGHNIANSQNYPAETADMKPIDYFSCHHREQFAIGECYQPTSLHDKTSDDIGRILTPGLSFLNIDVDLEIDQTFIELESYLALSQVISIQDVQLCAKSLDAGYVDLANSSTNSWREVEPQVFKAITLPDNNTERRTAVMHGQSTPGDSPQERDESLGRSNSVAYLAPDSKEGPIRLQRRNRGNRIDIVSKPEAASTNSEAPSKLVKRARKSKKKPKTQEEEDMKRKKFLERNRIAADRCRQNRKKWIDDLQEKCRVLRVDNEAKKAALEKVEHEFIQLKSVLLLHSLNCEDENIMTWADIGANQDLDLRKMKQIYADVANQEQLLGHDVSSDFQHSSSGSSMISKETRSHGLRLSTQSSGLGSHLAQSCVDKEKDKEK